MRIRRSKPTDNYVLIPNGTARDERLSYLARGVLVEILSRPDGWETNADALSERARECRGGKRGEGRRALREAFAELEAAGYMIRHKERGPKGRIVTLMEAYDTPQNRGAASGMSAATCDDAQTPSSDRDTANGTSEDHRDTANGTPAATSGNTENPRSHRGTANRRPVSGTSTRRRSTNHPPTPPESTQQAGPDGGKDQQRQQPPDLARAAAFLEALPAPWAVGPITAAEYAPLLLERARAQGWAPDAALAAKLTERPGRVDNYPAVLRIRIKDLPKAPAVPGQRPAAAPAPELPPYCGHIDCDPITRYRDHETDTGHHINIHCPECHPARKEQAA